MAEPPIGSVTAFAGPLNVVPQNWLVCDGRALDRHRFTALFDVVGTCWGGDANPNFRLPDLRGQFLRGVDKAHDGTASNPPVDMDRDQRVGFVPPGDPNNTGNAGNDVGSFQPDELRSHYHTSPAISGASNGGNDGGGWHSTRQNHNDPTTSTGGSETRPKNAYVFWIIKAS